MSNRSPKIAVLGAGGMLGSEVVDLFSGTGIGATGLDLPKFDITDYEQLKEVCRQSDLIINCAAYTNVEQAESEPDAAFAVNCEAEGMLGEYANQYGAKVIHISTDFVFDGMKAEPYSETDQTNPINVYGQSKLEGERRLLTALPNACVIRVEWTYGKNGNNFVNKIVELAGCNSNLKVVCDQVGSPTATKEIADLISGFTNEVPEGVFHFAADGYVSRFDVAEFVFGRLGIDVNLEKCQSGEFKSNAQRPANSRFNTNKIKSIINKPVRQWDSVLADYLERL